VRAWPGPRRAVVILLACQAGGLLVWLLERTMLAAGSGAGSQHVSLQILLFFTKAGAFVFGSGLAIVPFLQQGVVHDFGWLN